MNKNHVMLIILFILKHVNTNYLFLNLDLEKMVMLIMLISVN